MRTETSPPTPRTDFYAWTREQALLLRESRMTELDVEHLVEELESMGKSERRILENRLSVLIMHLLKWRFQPGRRGRSWVLTIKEQRRRVRRTLKENPSLKPELPEILSDVYEDARLMAARETNRDESGFPAGCPWTIEQIFDDAFWPDS